MWTSGKKCFFGDKSCENSSPFFCLSLFRVPSSASDYKRAFVCKKISSKSWLFEGVVNDLLRVSQKKLLCVLRRIFHYTSFPFFVKCYEVLFVIVDFRTFQFRVHQIAWFKSLVLSFMFITRTLHVHLKRALFVDYEIFHLSSNGPSSCIQTKGGVSRTRLAQKDNTCLLRLSKLLMIDLGILPSNYCGL